MTVPLWYVAHPVAPPCACGMMPSTPKDAVECNLDRARLWFRWLLDAAPNVALIASWMPYVEVVPDGDPKWRERGMRDNLAVVTRCDGIILVGGRLSGGMTAELAASRPRAGIATMCDLLHLGTHPPAVMPTDLPYPLGA
jgi:hypothetical protein